MKTALTIGRLLRSNINGCIIGCHINQQATIAFGSMVKIPLNDQRDTVIYAIVSDMHIDDDGLVRQLVAAEDVAEEVILDNRINRNVPIEISTLYLGYSTGGVISHLLPPKPPLVLDAIHACNQEEVVEFTGTDRFGYLRHILAAKDIPIEEILAAHLQQTATCHSAAGNEEWFEKATQELIIQLRDDYSLLMSVLSALSDVRLA